MLDQVINYIAGINPVITALVGSGLLDFLIRLFPTQKPTSLVRALAVALRKVAEIAVKVADILDKILPQNSVIK